jgi:hypothetical protein
MPREQLNAAESIRCHEESEPDDNGNVSAAAWDEMQPVVSLHWSDQYAQFGVKLDIATVRRMLKTLEDGAIFTEVFTPALTRRDMNTAVKIFRRARNAVHGADE